ncbi:AMP-binding protein [Riemerella columbina]|uniref:AMP-binding protein n=1 Tax=Riemerella columbina TaxID=103810 RepID=UPI0026700BF5|nr:AMP-binding protein [Riemerella columbina]WKS94791.1 AMP-binding protein [Riemerella columbina]
MLIDASQEIDISKLRPQNDFEHQVVLFLEDCFSAAPTVKVQTSGSTGTPKIFEVEKEKMKYSAQQTCRFLGLNKGDTALLCLPVAYISGKMMVVRALEQGLKLKVVPPSVQPLKNLNITVDFCAMTPLQVEHSLAELHQIRKLIIGGAAVSETLNDKILDLKIPHQKVYETYGMSETLSHIALREISPQKAQYFKALDGVQLFQDERGCLGINAPKLNEDQLITNDLVAFGSPQEFYFLGRVDSIINSGGAKIFPEQLEALAKRTIDRELVFIGVKDEVLGEKLIVVVEGEETPEIKTQIENLAYEKSFHRPKAVVFMPKIPRTPNGKVSRLELKKCLE